MKTYEIDMPELTKQQCRDLAPNNYHYVGYWDGHYHYQSGGYPDQNNYKTGGKYTGFLCMACLREDMTSCNLEFMADKELTRIT